MTAASADLTQVRDTEKAPKSLSVELKNAAQVYLNAYGAIDTSVGRLKAWADGAGEVLLGPIRAGDNYGTGLGNTSATQIPAASIQADDHLRYGVAVTGTSAVTDHGSLVYLADDQTFTLTRGTLGLPIGFVARWITGTTCDVFVFGVATLCSVYLGGCGAQLVHLGNFDAPNLTTATDPIIATIPGRYRVRSIYATVAKTLAGGTSIVFTFKKNTTAFTTGGVLTLTTNAAGTTNVAATAITQDSTTILSESDVLRATVAVTGAYTADVGGNFNVFALIDRQLGV